MKISSLIDIIDGELLNTPSISFIYSFKTKAKKVKESDLFIARNINDIETAIQNGAYAIVLEEKYPLLDKEIAWIKVDSIDKVLVQLIRYRLANFNLKAYYSNKAIYNFLNIFSNDINLKFIPWNLDDFIKTLNDIDNDSTLICHDKNVLDMLYPNNTKFKSINHITNNLTEHSLFESSFSYKDKFFSRLKISSLYINDFLDAYTYLNYDFDFTKLKTFYNLKPLFLDKRLNITEYGKSDKFMLMQNNISLAKKEITYIKEKYKYAKTIFVSSKYVDFLDEEQYVLDDIDKLKNYLKTIEFNAVYMLGFSFEEIFISLNKEDESNKLF